MARRDEEIRNRNEDAIDNPEHLFRREEIVADILWLLARVERLEAALRAIGNHPHKSYDHPENGTGAHCIGIADGHRCAAEIALAALAEED